MIERVVVTLDAATENRPAIDTAARLAARTKARLHGVFVEDQDLLDLAGLPFARQVTIDTGIQRLTTESVKLYLLARAERARQELFAAAEQHEVECTFEVVRGESEIATASASEHDLVVAGGLSRPVAGHFRVERRWLPSVKAARGPLLLARTAWTAPGSTVVLLRDRDPASARLVEAAAQVASVRGNVLTVITPSGVAGTEGFDKWISDRIGEYPVRVQVEIAPADTSTIDARLAELDCRLLAFEAGLVEGSGARLQRVIERFTCDLLIVR